jgi:hypothetical protein
LNTNFWIEHQTYRICKYILDLGLLLYLLEINISWRLLQLIVVIINLGATVVFIIQPFVKIGFDFTAYVNQGG